MLKKVILKCFVVVLILLSMATICLVGCEKTEEVDYEVSLSFELYTHAIHKIPTNSPSIKLDNKNNTYEGICNFPFNMGYLRIVIYMEGSNGYSSWKFLDEQLIDRMGIKVEHTVIDENGSERPGVRPSDPYTSTALNNEQYVFENTSNTQLFIFKIPAQNKWFTREVNTKEIEYELKFNFVPDNKKLVDIVLEPNPNLSNSSIVKQENTQSLDYDFYIIEGDFIASVVDFETRELLTQKFWRDSNGTAEGEFVTGVWKLNDNYQITQNYYDGKGLYLFRLEFYASYTYQPKVYYFYVSFK